MATLAEVKQHALRLQAAGDAFAALRCWDAVVAGAPLDIDARVKVADALAALRLPGPAVEVYRAVARYAIKSGHPLAAIVCARVIESLGGEVDDVHAALVAHYGSESELIGNFAARINQPPGATEIAPPDLAAPPSPDLARFVAERAIGATASFSEWPAALHPIPLLSELSEAAFRRVLGTLVVRRLPHGAPVIREGEMGESFFFVAAGAVRVFDTDGAGRQKELAVLRENAVFGEMALLSARPRSASVEVVGEADLIEVTRASLAAVSGELEQVAAALTSFTRDRLISNMLRTSPLFRPFSRPQQRDLLRRFTAHDVAPGTTIIRQGDEGRGLFLVLSGEVEVAAGPTPLATLRAGDVFGEMSLIAGGPTTATVTAASQGTVLFLAKDYVDRIVAGVPEISRYLAALAEDRALDTRLALQDGGEGDDGAVFI